MYDMVMHSAHTSVKQCKAKLSVAMATMAKYGVAMATMVKLIVAMLTMAMYSVAMGTMAIYSVAMGTMAKYSVAMGTGAGQSDWRERGRCAPDTKARRHNLCRTQCLPLLLSI